MKIISLHSTGGSTWEAVNPQFAVAVSGTVEEVSAITNAINQQLEDKFGEEWYFAVWYEVDNMTTENTQMPTQDFIDKFIAEGTEEF